MKHLLRHLVPHFFYKEPLGEITNPELLGAIETIRQLPSAEEALQKCLDLLSTRYRSMRFLTYLLFWRWFETDPNKLWNRLGPLHCTHQNFLLRVLMVKSGQVKDEDIELGYALVWHISPHQFLKFKVGGKTIAVDPWNYFFGAKLGTYASGFGMKRG